MEFHFGDCGKLLSEFQWCISRILELCDFVLIWEIEVLIGVIFG